jgi:ParB family chromosome partitioning protein
MNPEPLHPAGLRREPDGGQGGLRARAVPIGHLAPDPEQPRRRIDPEELAELVASVRALGIVQPIVVTPHPDPAARRATPLLILLGERRWAAARAAGLESVPVVVRTEPLGAGERLMLQLEENDGELRRDLPLYDRALAVARARELSGLPKLEFAQRMGKSPTMLAKYYAVARARGPVREALEEGYLRGMVAARLFASLPAEAQRRVLEVARRTRSPITDNQIEAAARRGEGAGAAADEEDHGAGEEERARAGLGGRAAELEAAGLAAGDLAAAGDSADEDEDTETAAAGGPPAASAEPAAAGQGTTARLRRADFSGGRAGRVELPERAGDVEGDGKPGGTGAGADGGNGVAPAGAFAAARLAVGGGEKGLAAAATEAPSAGISPGAAAAGGRWPGGPGDLAETAGVPLPSRAAAGFLDAGSTIARARGAGLGSQGDGEVVRLALTRLQLATLIRRLGGTPRGGAEDQVRQLHSLLT